MYYYIASCVFTERFPKLSEKVRNYVQSNYDMEIVGFIKTEKER